MWFYEMKKLHGHEHMTNNCHFIRPGSNPLTRQSRIDMMNSPDVKVTHSELIKINKLEVVGDMAYACYTTHGKFNYKGTENDDIAVLTLILRKINGDGKVHGQRSTGRKPSDPLPEF